MNTIRKFVKDLDVGDIFETKNEFNDRFVEFRESTNKFGIPDQGWIRVVSENDNVAYREYDIVTVYEYEDGD